MKETVLKRLCCAICRGELCYQSFEDRFEGVIEQGVVWCTVCRNWFPIADGLLELLPPQLAYRDDRQRFWKNHWRRLRALNIREMEAERVPASRDQLRQQAEQFDWHVHTADSSARAYEQIPFWRAVDGQFHANCRREMKAGQWLLDIGCAQGRSTAPFMDLPLNIVSLDTSKTLIRRARTHYRQHAYRAQATFFVGDRTRLPFNPRTFDYVVIQGGLLSFPNPALACRQIVRALRPGGIFWGGELNRSGWHRFFHRSLTTDPRGQAKVDADSFVSLHQLHHWFAGLPVRIECRTHGFILPPLVNGLGRQGGSRLFEVMDWIGQRLPWIRHRGGLILYRAQRQEQASARVRSNEAA